MNPSIDNPNLLDPIHITPLPTPVLTRVSSFTSRSEYFGTIEEEDSPFPEVQASVSNVGDPDMPAMTLRMWFVGNSVFNINCLEHLFQLPFTGSCRRAYRTTPDLLSHWQVSCFRPPTHLSSTCNNIPTSLDHSYYPPSRALACIRIFSQSRHMEHQGTRAGAHHGQRRRRSSMRSERHRRVYSILRTLDEEDDDEGMDDAGKEDEDEVAEAKRDHHPRIDEVDYTYDCVDPIDPEREREDGSGKHVDEEHEVDHEDHHQMRKHENLNVGRPRTPEPSFGLREQPASSNEITVDTKSPSLSINSNGTTPVGELERMVREEKEEEELEIVVAEPEPVVAENSQNEDGDERKPLTSSFTEFKKSFDGQWNEVKEEWREERERLGRAREEWESKSKALDVNLEKKTELMRLQERVAMKHQQQFTSGEMVESDLVTLPSTRSQTSASPGEEEEDAAPGLNSKGDRRRRMQKSGSQRGINVIRRNLDHDMMNDEEAALSDGATLALGGITGLPFRRLSVFSFVCWAAPSNVGPANQLFGIHSGL
ncbi:hypothetical protein Agabi119p4_9004 [Agaricus bisporus var. burnettii]|uniref:Uncharacterized protein n=1 Tax=Agaricus bisporus var. burnettii TaxID=192524 RepID=A0A8H7C5N9_AGABI|nr:hypothetical protein Agabi119p4_9004 [Agaricus bisporus var. burnettii]